MDLLPLRLPFVWLGWLTTSIDTVGSKRRMDPWSPEVHRVFLQISWIILYQTVFSLGTLLWARTNVFRCIPAIGLEHVWNCFGGWLKIWNLVLFLTFFCLPSKFLESRSKSQVVWTIQLFVMLPMKIQRPASDAFRCKNKNKKIGRKRTTTNNQQQMKQQPTTTNETTTNNQQPTTSNQQPATNN